MGYLSYLLPFCISVAALGYYLYKLFRAPWYRIGDAKKLMEHGTAVGENDDEWIVSPSMHLWKTSTVPTPASSKSRTTAPVICVHGGPARGPADAWHLLREPLLSPLAMHLHHARGCGRSSRPFDAFPASSFYKGATELERTLGVAEQLADIERIRRHLGVSKVSLVGHSFGGFLATLYAAEFPEHVQSLVLLAPASMLAMPSNDFDFFAQVRQGLATEERQLEFDAFLKRYLDFPGLVALDEHKAASVQIEFDSFWAEANPDSPIEGTVDERRALVGGWAAYATYLSLGIEYDLRPTLKDRFASASFPTYIVHGGKDTIPVSESRKYVDLFPPDKVTFAVLDSAGHFLPNDEPRALAALVLDTLTRPTR